MAMPPFRAELAQPLAVAEENAWPGWRGRVSCIAHEPIHVSLMQPTRDDPVLVSARREAVVVAVIWIAAMAYTVTYCYLNGYHRSLESLTFVLGVPDWIFWGIVTPWLACLAASWAFSYLLMTDADLGAENDDAEEDANV
jgi:hypothetical protein